MPKPQRPAAKKLTRMRVVTDDGWDTDKGYSVDDFYVGATDGRGHHSVARVALTPEISGEIAALVASGKIPAYRTFADVVRDALVHRLHYVSTVTDMPGLAESISRMRAAELVERMARRRDEYEEMVGKIQRIRQVNGAFSPDSVEMLRQHLQFWEEPYRTSLLDLLPDID